MVYCRTAALKIDRLARDTPIHSTSLARIQNTLLKTGFSARKPCLLRDLLSESALVARTKQPAEDALHAHLAGRNREWLQLRISRLKLDVHAASIKSLQGRLVFFDE